MKISQKIRFGVIGCSRVAQKGMLPALRDSEYAELAMVGSRNFEKAKEVASQFGGNEWGTYDDVLKNKNIDAVYVSLPNALHEEWTIKAIEAGKHVICEKPAAISYAAAQRMVESARKKNVRLLDGLMFQYHPQHARVRSLIDSGVLGNPIKFDGCFAYAMPDRASNAMSKELGGGSFNDQAPYPICASRMIFKEEPESVLCTMQLDLQSGVPIKSDIILYYSDNKTAFASSIFGSYYQSTYSVLGSKAHIRMGRAYAVSRDVSTKIFLDTNDAVEEMVVPPADHFRLMLDDFCAEIVKGVKSIKKYEEDLLAQARVLEAAKLSYLEGRIVRLSEITDSVVQTVHIHALPQETFKKVLLTGGSGNLGRAIVRSGLFHNILSPTHEEFDITDRTRIRSFLEANEPDAVIHAAAIVKMAQADKDLLRIETNIVGTSNLVYEIIRLNEKKNRKIRFIYISTDGVYEGTKGNYAEDDETIPYNNYGWTKLGGECAVKTLSSFCIIRTSFFDPNNIPFDTAAIDMYSSKMPVDDLPSAIKCILESTFSGVINIGDERKSHYERYRETKPSIQPRTFEDVTKTLSFNMARDASLDVSLWKKVRKLLNYE